MATGGIISDFLFLFFVTHGFALVGAGGVLAGTPAVTESRQVLAKGWYSCVKHYLRCSVFN